MLSYFTGGIHGQIGIPGCTFECTGPFAFALQESGCYFDGCPTKQGDELLACFCSTYNFDVIESLFNYLFCSTFIASFGKTVKIVLQTERITAETFKILDPLNLQNLQFALS